MKKIKSLPLIVTSLLLCMPLSACNLGVGDNKNSSEATSSSSSSEGNSIPNPNKEVTFEDFIVASIEAERINPEYRSADVTMFYYNGTEQNITAKFHKTAKETEYWNMLDEDILVGDAYEMAGNLIETHATYMRTYSATMHENKYYYDATGFKYVGIYNGEYQGTVYKQEVTFIFDEYGYCLYAKQTVSSDMTSQDTFRFTAVYSTEPIPGGGGTETIPQNEITLEQWRVYCNCIEKVNSRYLSATLQGFVRTQSEGSLPTPSKDVAIIFSNQTGARGSFSEYKIDGDSSIASPFRSLINYEPSRYANYSNARFFHNLNLFTVWIKDEEHFLSITFDEDGYIYLASNTFTNSEGVSTTYTTYVVQYSKKPVDGGDNSNYGYLNTLNPLTFIK